MLNLSLKEFKEDLHPQLKAIVQIALGIPHVPLDDLDDLVVVMNDMNEAHEAS